MAATTPSQASTTRPCSVREAVSGSNMFVIQGYSAAKGIGVGKYIASEEFTMGGYKWAIYFYPDGNDDPDFVSVYIALKSEARNVQALFELTLMDQSGKGKHRVHSCFKMSRPRTLKVRGSMWGYKCYFRRVLLEASNYLRDDCLKIQCTVGVVVSAAIDCSRPRSIHVPDSNIASHIGMLLENRDGCDVTFNVSGEELHAHKLILAARSPKLYSEFFQEVDREKVMVPDMEPKIFKALLHFLYRDTLAENELITSSSCSTSSVADTLIAKLMAAADRYDLERLKRLCESRLFKDISVNSDPRVLVLSDQCHAGEDVCFEFAAENLADETQSAPVSSGNSAREMAETPSRNLMSPLVSGTNLFVIHGYSLVIGVGEYIASDKFTVGGLEWAICFYPRGKDNSDYVSMFIGLTSQGKDVQALFELTLIDQSGKGNHKVHSCFNKSHSHTLQPCAKFRMWGYKRFFKREMLERSDYLRDDCLKVYCTVGVVVSASDCSRLRAIQVPNSDIGLHIGMLLENMEGCDITFNISGEKLHAHKLILAARSPKLWSEFLQGVDREEVKVQDMEPKIFKALLHFLYTDALAENELITSSSCSATSVADTLIGKLLAAADRYDLERLKRLCESHLCKDISVNSVTQILALADRCHAAELKDVCLKFASENLTAVVHYDGFEYLKEKCTFLKPELLITVAAGGGEGCSNSGVKPDGGDDRGRRVKQRMEESASNGKGKTGSSSRNGVE